MQPDTPTALAGLSDAEVIGLIWPSGLSVRDRALIATMSAAHRKRTMDRLRALMDDTLLIGERAKAAGLSRPAFNDLRKRWLNADVRTLDLVVPYVNRPVRQPPEYPAAEAAASLAVREMPDKSVEAVAQHLMETLQDAPGRSTLRRIVAAAKRETIRADAAEVTGPYVLDYSSTNVLVVSDDGPQFADVALVFEKDRGLVIGGAAGARDETARVTDAALARAEETLKDHWSEAPALPQRLRLKAAVMPPEAGDPISWFRLRGKLLREVGEGALTEQGPRRFGRQIATSIGNRLGSIHLKPRRIDVSSLDTPANRVVTKGAVRTPAEVDALLQLQIAVHNNAVWTRLAESIEPMFDEDDLEFDPRPYGFNRL